MQKKSLLEMSNKRIGMAVKVACYGLHGQLSFILKDVKYFFSCKNRGDDRLAKLMFAITCCHIKHMLILDKLANKYQNQDLFLKYEKNSWEYYQDFKCLCESKKIILDQLLAQKFTIKNYQRILSVLNDKQDIQTIRELIEENQLNIKQLSEYLA